MFIRGTLAGQHKTVFLPEGFTLGVALINGKAQCCKVFGPQRLFAFCNQRASGSPALLGGIHHKQSDICRGRVGVAADQVHDCNQRFAIIKADKIFIRQCFTWRKGLQVIQNAGFGDHGRVVTVELRVAAAQGQDGIRICLCQPPDIVPAGKGLQVYRGLLFSFDLFFGGVYLIFW